MPPSLGSKAHQSPTDRMNSSRVTTSAIRLAPRSSPRRIGTTPASGSSTSACRIHRSNAMELSSSVMAGSPDHRVEHPQSPCQEKDDIYPDRAGLKPAAEPAETARDASRSIHRGAVYNSLVHTPPENDPGEPDQRTDDHP